MYFHAFFKLMFSTSCLRLFSSELESIAGSQKEQAGSGNLLEEPRPRTTRQWTPLSIFNSDYVTLLKERERTLIRHDFIRENIVSQMHIIMKDTYLDLKEDSGPGRKTLFDASTEVVAKLKK